MYDLEQNWRMRYINTGVIAVKGRIQIQGSPQRGTSAWLVLYNATFIFQILAYHTRVRLLMDLHILTLSNFSIYELYNSSDYYISNFNFYISDLYNSDFYISDSYIFYFYISNFIATLEVHHFGGTRIPHTWSVLHIATFPFQIGTH